MRFVDKLAFANRLVWPFAVLGKLAFNALEKLGRLHFFWLDGFARNRFCLAWVSEFLFPCACLESVFAFYEKVMSVHLFFHKFAHGYYCRRKLAYYSFRLFHLLVKLITQVKTSICRPKCAICALKTNGRDLAGLIFRNRKNKCPFLLNF